MSKLTQPDKDNLQSLWDMCEYLGGEVEDFEGASRDEISHRCKLENGTRIDVTGFGDWRIITQGGYGFTVTKGSSGVNFHIQATKLGGEPLSKGVKSVMLNVGGEDLTEFRRFYLDENGELHKEL